MSLGFCTVKLRVFCVQPLGFLSSGFMGLWLMGLWVSGLGFMGFGVLGFRLWVLGF